MSRILKFTAIAALVAATLACGLISNPLNQVQGLASTAQALASSMPVSTLEALPSSMPNVSGMFKPTGKPVANWNGIPILPQAVAGQEFDAHHYSYTAAAAAADVQAYYEQQMKALGWQSQLGFQVSTQGGVMVFQKASALVEITIAPDPNNSQGVVVIIQQ